MIWALVKHNEVIFRGKPPTDTNTGRVSRAELDSSPDQPHTPGDERTHNRHSWRHGHDGDLVYIALLAGFCMWALWHLETLH